MAFVMQDIHRNNVIILGTSSRANMVLYQRTGSWSSIIGFPVNGQVVFKMLFCVLVITTSSCSSPGIGSPAW